MKVQSLLLKKSSLYPNCWIRRLEKSFSHLFASKKRRSFLSSFGVMKFGMYRNPGTCVVISMVSQKRKSHVQRPIFQRYFPKERNQKKNERKKHKRKIFFKDNSPFYNVKLTNERKKKKKSNYFLIQRYEKN